MLVSSPTFSCCVSPQYHGLRGILYRISQPPENPETNLKKREMRPWKWRQLSLQNQVFSHSSGQTHKFRSGLQHRVFASPPRKCSDISTVTLNILKQSHSLYTSWQIHADLWRGMRTASHGHGSAENLILHVKHLYELCPAQLNAFVLHIRGCNFFKKRIMKDNKWQRICKILE